MFFEAMDLDRILDLKFNPMDRDRILLNYTRIENAHKVHKKTFVFCDL